jgi:uncharacterized damage-inducible protein DinB
MSLVLKLQDSSIAFVWKSSPSNPSCSILPTRGKRTLRVARCIPPDKIDWTYAVGKFTLGDLLRHLVVTERYMWAENVRNRPSRYISHGQEFADSLESILTLMERLHSESMEIFSQLTDEDLSRKCTTPGGTDISTWKWLRAMAEHEAHHRGQIYLYLSILGVETPPIFGLTSEQVRARGTAPALRTT